MNRKKIAEDSLVPDIAYDSLDHSPFEEGGLDDPDNAGKWTVTPNTRLPNKVPKRKQILKERMARYGSCVRSWTK